MSDDAKPATVLTLRSADDQRLDKIQQVAIQLLEEQLALAKAGKVQALLIVTELHEGYASNFTPNLDLMKLRGILFTMLIDITTPRGDSKPDPF